ncbi:MAG: PQQ-binding-like beta-propeller repeat protein [Gemmataceae bacterium]
MMTLACFPLLTAADWPVFRGNSAMTGLADTEIKGELDVAWTFKTGNAIDSTPVVVNGVVYVGSADKHVYAVDFATGLQKWKTPLGSPVRAAPGVKDGRVYLGDVDGKFHCLDAATGKIIWSFEAKQEIVSGCNFFEDKILFGSNDGCLYCLNADGKQQWAFSIDQPINGSPAVANGYSFIAGCDEILHVIDLKTGKEVGQVGIGGPAGATAAVAGKMVYVGTMSNQVIAVDLTKPEAPTKSWTFEAAKRQQPFYSSAAVTDSLVILGSRDKRLYALNRKTGQEAWSFPTDSMIDSSAVVLGDSVYFGSASTDGNFYCLELKSGKKKQEMLLDSAITSSPAVGPNAILVGTEKGTLYCLKGVTK